MKRILAAFLIEIAAQHCQNSKSEIVTIEDVLNNPTEYLNQGVRIQGIVSQVDSDKQQFSIMGEKGFVYETKNIRNVKDIPAK